MVVLFVLCLGVFCCFFFLFFFFVFFFFFFFFFFGAVGALCLFSFLVIANCKIVSPCVKIEDKLKWFQHQTSKTVKTLCRIK